MFPALNDGDFVVTIPRWLSTIKVGHLLVVSHPHYQVIVKRVIAIGDNGRFLLAGDNCASIHSYQMGWLAKRDVLGTVLFSIKKSHPSHYNAKA